MRWLIATTLLTASAAALWMAAGRGSANGGPSPLLVAHDLMEQGKPAETLELLSQVSTEVIPAEDRTELEVDATTELRDVFRLSALYDRDPEAVLADEAAAQMVARTATYAGDETTAETAASRWSSSGAEPHAWHCLEADRLLKEGDSTGAVELLRSRTFEGDRDVGRLSRLAMLTAAEDPDAALGLMTEAVTKAPRSGDAHLFRGQLLEGLSRLKEARVEYVTAVAAVPENPFFRLQLADFYCRNGSHTLAMDSWRDALGTKGGAVAAVRIAFWSHVTRPSETPLPPVDDVPETDRKLYSLLRLSPADQFWNDDAFSAVLNNASLAESRQEVFWLRLLQALHDGDDLEAERLLTGNRFRSQSWNAVLEDGLRSLLSVRTKGHRLPSPIVREEGDLHPLLDALLDADCEDIDAGLAEFLRTPDAVPAVLIACGWLEAAVRMPHSLSLPNEEPHYLAFAMAQAYRTVREPEQAIRFARRQTPSPEMDVLLGELLYADEKKDEAIATWRLAAGDPGPAGYRASWMLGVELLTRGRIVEAETVIASHADLADAVSGQELLARIALLRGDVAAAERIYSAIETESVQAMVFAVRRDLVAGRINRARERARAILAAHPDAPSVRKLIVDLENLPEVTADTGGQT